MADIIVGYAPQPTLSDDGTGNTRVTFGPWELDWEWFNLMAVGVDFVANTNTLTTAMITAKGGTERTGYYFDLQLAFGTWAAGNRCSPQRGAVVSWRTTWALGWAAAVVLDSILFWAQTATGRDSCWALNTGATVKGVDIFGMFARQQTVLMVPTNVNGFVTLSGNLNAINRQLIYRNVTLVQDRGNGAFAYWNDTGGAGRGIFIDRVRSYGVQLLSLIAGGVRVCEARNSFTLGTSAASVALACGAIFRFLTGYGGASGINCNGSPSILENCLMFSATNCYAGVAAAVMNTCGSFDATGTVGLRNLVDGDMRWWWDNDYGNVGRIPFLMSTSPMRGIGTFVPGLTWDILGETRANPPTLGCHEGLEVKAVQNYQAPIPAGFAAVDALTGTEIIFSWTNGADYLAADRVIIYDNAANVIGESLASAGAVRLGGFPNGVPMLNMYATGVSDNGVESAISALATATPTGANTCAGILHMRCDAAADEESVTRYLWFISPDAVTAQARRLLAQAQIDAREEVTDYNLATPIREAETDGQVANNWYWCFVVAVDEDNLGTPTAVGDVGVFQAEDGMAAVGTGAKQRIVALDGLGVRIDG